MAKFDCFNGDADGICSLIQFRNEFPCDSTLVTGVKRDIKLVQKLSLESGDQVLVLDVSLEKNHTAVQAALDTGAEVLYFDHHFAGDAIVHDNLESHINTSSDVCTAMLVNRYLEGKYIEWAIVGAFGDNLFASAESLAQQTPLQEREVALLKDLGTYINYNGYGAALSDLHFEPIDLYKKMLPYSSPLAFIEKDNATFESLKLGYETDMANAASVEAFHETASTAAFIFPNETWARRVSGVYSNDLANGSPDRAHAVLTEKSDGNYLVSVRAPLNNKVGADELCLQFATGGGRKAAAGINDLEKSQLNTFLDAFDQQFSEKVIS